MTDPIIDFKPDKYEKEIISGLEKEGYKSVSNAHKLKKDAKKRASNTIKILRKNKTISLRLSEVDIEKLKYKSKRVGIPYQTLSASILHQYAHDILEVKI